MSGHSDTERVHGVDGQDRPADWSALRRGELAELLAEFPHTGKLQQIQWRSPRPLSAAATVATGSGPLFVKRHHISVRTAATLAEEHRFIEHLHAAGTPVPRVLRNVHDNSAVVRGDWTYEVHSIAPGLDVYRDLESWVPVSETRHAFQAGRTLAQLHENAAAYSAAQRDTFILVTRDDLVRAADPLSTLEAQLPRRPGLADFLRHKPAWRRQFVETIVLRQQGLPSRIKTQPRLWTHNDWHVSNLAWSGRGPDATVSAVFDFGLASPTFALFDLATAIERNAIAWLELERGADAVHTDIALALIEGYRSLRPLSASDLELLADLLPVVHVDFALSELEYFHAITRSPDDAEVAWSTFLLGHARWFDTPPARELLDAIAGA